MPSPFPGMDPYLEWHWGDVHTRLIVYTCDQLRGQLPAELRVRAEEEVTIEPRGPQGRAYYPDVRVVEDPVATYGRPGLQSVAGLVEPFVVSLEAEPATERSVRIVDTRSGDRVVTVIEFISRANKFSEPGREAYRKKQQDMMAGGVNLAEIDLLRGGHYVLAAPEEHVPADYHTTYRISVFRASRPRHFEVYRAPLAERLPTIRIPLRPADKDVFLDIQQLIELAYENGGYGQDIDYGVEPVPAFQPSEARWADELLRERRLR